jgi:hypothetical protein
VSARAGDWSAFLRTMERQQRMFQKYAKPAPKKATGIVQIPFEYYQQRPVEYANDVLGVLWWEKQQQVAESVSRNPKTLVRASHGIGKTHLAGGLVSWHYDCYRPSITKTTAPTSNQVRRLTWKEVRLQRKGRGMLPKAPEIQEFSGAGEYNPGHFAAGYTAKDADSFQGDHSERLLIIFEEAVGIDEQFWTAAEGMLSSGEGNKWLAIMNPTDTASTAYQQERAGGWHVITISALEHPNLLAELMDQPKPFPNAISLSWVQERLTKWCTPIEAGDAKAGDFCWPYELVDIRLRTELPGTERRELLEAQRKELVRLWEARKEIPIWYRPGPLFESRALGRWPSQATNSVWSQAKWDASVVRREDLWEEAKRCPVEIGCDVALFGDDFTTIHVRRGPCSIHHEAHNGWDRHQTAARLKELARRFGQEAGQDPKEVEVKVDDSGVGHDLVPLGEGYNFIGINAADDAIQQEDYPNRRSELWFAVAERADQMRLDLSGLPLYVRAELERQFMAPLWKLDSQGRRVVEKKDETKKRIKRSPDDADAVNLAYAPAPPGIIAFSGTYRH